MLHAHRALGVIFAQAQHRPCNLTLNLAMPRPPGFRFGARRLEPRSALSGHCRQSATPVSNSSHGPSNPRIKMSELCNQHEPVDHIKPDWSHLITICVSSSQEKGSDARVQGFWAVVPQFKS